MAHDKPSTQLCKACTWPAPPSRLGHWEPQGGQLRHHICETHSSLNASLASVSGARKQILKQLHSLLDLVPSVLV